MQNWQKKWDLILVGSKLEPKLEEKVGSKVSTFCYIKVTVFSNLLIRFSFFQVLLRCKIGRKSGIYGK